tara:strand:- start:318 stop:590 length:273 start_codon:yes stop_codon:yes gene_type:complete
MNSGMIDTDKYEGCLADMKGYDLAMLAKELLAEVKRLENKALVFDTIYDFYERMQLQSESYENQLWRMDWLLENPTKEYEDYDRIGLEEE